MRHPRQPIEEKRNEKVENKKPIKGYIFMSVHYKQRALNPTGTLGDSAQHSSELFLLRGSRAGELITNSAIIVSNHSRVLNFPTLPACSAHGLKILLQLEQNAPSDRAIYSF